MSPRARCSNCRREERTFPRAYPPGLPVRTMADPMDAHQRGEARSWADKAHTYAAWLEWTITILATVAGLVVAASVVTVRASARAAGSGETDLLLDIGLPGLIVLGAGVLGYIAGLLAASAFRCMGHMVRTTASIDARLDQEDV